MSTHKDRIRDLSGALARRAAEAEPPAPQVYATLSLERAEEEPGRGAIAAIARNIIAQDNAQVVGATVTLLPTDNSLERQGCKFIKYAYIFLGLLDCPGDARDIILWFAGYSNGNHRDALIITQEQIAKSMGLSLDTVQRKLKALEKWEQQTNRTVIQIQKQPYDKELRKYPPTQYRVVVAKYIGEFARRIEGAPFLKRDDHAALKSAITEGHREMAEEIADDMPLAPTIPRKVKNVTPPQQQLSFIEAKLDRVLRAVADYRDALAAQNFSLSDAWTEMVIEEEKAFFKME